MDRQTCRLIGEKKERQIDRQIKINVSDKISEVAKILTILASS